AHARPDMTTMFYMGGRQASVISNQLQAHGASPETPVIVMRSVSQQEQTSWIGTLQDLACGVETLRSNGPVLIGIGSAFGKVIAGVPEFSETASLESSCGATMVPAIAG
ncbi:MAG: hypothetical protein NWT00_00930, partial [Beijerinckiaceae bacterium]|nr:hypothetical protein [Beijerinckiaceae bacterium]